MALPNMLPQTFGQMLMDREIQQQALRNAILQNKYFGPNAESEIASRNALTEGQKIANEFAPTRLKSEAASKLAYANLMGPQFLSKLMGNNDILANIPPNQRQEALERLYQAGTGNNLNNNPNNELKDFVVNQLKNTLSKQDANEINKMQPGDSYVIQGNQPRNALLNNPGNVNNNSFAENVGRYEGIKREGEEAGKIRANDIKDLNDIVLNADIKLDTLNDIGNMISSPEMREIRQLPLAGRHEIGYYSKQGTPAQQQLIGRLYTQMGNVIKDSSRDFAGQFRRGEQQLLQGMKPNDSDTIDVMIGKAESLMVMNKLLRDRASLTSKYMKEDHIDKGQALEIADKQINADKVRNDIHNQLNPKPTEDDISYMAKIHNLSIDEVKKRLKDKGLS